MKKIPKEFFDKLFPGIKQTKNVKLPHPQECIRCKPLSPENIRNCKADWCYYYEERNC